MSEDEKKTKVGSVGVETLPEIVLPSDDSAKMVQSKEMATYNTLMKVATSLWSSGMFPSAGSPAGVFAIVLYGHEHGIPPMTALGVVHVIKGNLGFSAQFIQAKVERADVVVDIIESDSEHCVLEFSGRPGKKNMTSTYTIDDAKRAGLVKDGGNYRKSPADMLYCRALTRGARRYAPDAILGMYDKEELEAIEPNVVIPGKADNGKTKTENLADNLGVQAGMKVKKEPDKPKKTKTASKPKSKRAPKTKKAQKAKKDDSSIPPEPHNVKPTKPPEEPQKPAVDSYNAEDFADLFAEWRDILGEDRYIELMVKYSKRRLKDWTPETLDTEYDKLTIEFQELPDAPAKTEETQ